jgi:hypothetical protein
MSKYALRYQTNMEFRDEGYTAEEAGDCGLTDCFIGISILLPEDGSYSQAIVVADNGKEKRKMTQKEIFKAWMMLGLSLHDQGELQGWQAAHVKTHSDIIRSMFNRTNKSAIGKKKK